MPPRIPLAPASNSFNVTTLLLSLPSLNPTRSYAPCIATFFSTSSVFQAKQKKKTRRRIDPYRAAQARQRKSANEARQLVLKKERLEAMGDPVRSQPSDFIRSLKQLPSSTGTQTSDQFLNFYVNPQELNKSLDYSKFLTEPIPPGNLSRTDPAELQQKLEQHQFEHENALRAMKAITSLGNGNKMDRTRVNIQRCISEFGRHVTDTYLPPKPASSATVESETGDSITAAIAKRAGPDTGSSEVQVAILTTKINSLADDLHNKDKHNKRNLRVLIHKRQKLLAYLRRKERGGPRWQNLVEKLGVNDAMWKGEISL